MKIKPTQLKNTTKTQIVKTDIGGRSYWGPFRLCGPTLYLAAQFLGYEAQCVVLLEYT